MQKRKSHNKSRRGCLNCKKRHVKCDEQGPPCANCVVRETTSTCTYTSKTRTARIPTISDITSSSSSSSPTPPILDFPCNSRRLLELELMHRWAISTYKAFCSTTEEHHYLQVDFPRESLKLDFLLHGILALSALDVAMCEAPAANKARYSRLAMEYYDTASSQFRAQLSNITNENIHGIFLFSFMAMSMNMGIAQCSPGDQQQSLLGRIPVLFELVIGSTSFFFRYAEWMMDGPFAAAIIQSAKLIREPPPELDPSSNAALGRLATVVENGITSKSENHLVSQSDRSRTDLYRVVITHLYTCYVEDARDAIQGFCFAFPSYAGPEFSTAIAELEPTALFILIHWAVLLDRADHIAFWARSVGSNLVLEVSAALHQLYPEIASMPKWREGIDWARQQVGFPPFG